MSFARETSGTVAASYLGTERLEQHEGEAMRTSLIVAGGLALALSLSACGGTGGGKFEDVDSLARAAATSTEKAKSSKFTMDMKMGPITMTGQGAGSYGGPAPKMSMDMSMDLSALGSGVGKLDIEARLIGQDMYMKLPSDMPGISTDPEKPWYKVALADMVPGSGVDMTKYLEQTDPGKMIEVLKESGELVDTDPDVSVDGQPATMYSFDVDFNKMMEQYGGSLDSVPGLDSVDVDTIPMDVFLNSEDLPVQIRIDFAEFMQEVVEAAGGEDNLPAGMSFDDAHMTMRFTDWGSEVTVEAPPADEVSDAPLPGMGG